MSNPVWHTFLELLRAGLWEQDPHMAAVPDSNEWAQIMQLGRSQAVMGLLLSGIARLPEEQRPGDRGREWRARKDA